MMGGNAEEHPRLMASPLGYFTAKSVATACGVATRMAVVLFPEAQYPTSALAAASGLAWGAGGMTGAAVVGTGAVAVVEGAGGIVAIVVEPNTVVVGSVVGVAAGEELQALAARPSPATTAATAAGILRMLVEFTIPLWQTPACNFGRGGDFSDVRAS
jgi:hypothetical protein